MSPATTQRGTAPIFFAGDAEGHLPLLHEAADEGRIAGANALLLPAVERRERRLPLAIAFTDPQMALVGARHADLPAGLHTIGTASFENQGRARVTGRNRGVVCVYGETRSRRLLGEEMFGPGMEHMAHLLALAAQTCRCPSTTRCWRKACAPPCAISRSTCMRRQSASQRTLRTRRAHDEPGSIVCGPSYFG
jgi:pyruvate/2-oxoglutarate dehydrogenase complex dihydrolipoamide dehydrogenase (E3) component